MTKRFANLQNRGPAVESPNWGDPGDYRNRNKGDALVPSQDPKYAKRLPEFRPQVPASSAKASVSTAPAPIAATKPKAPVKSASKIAAEAYAERAAKVMGSPATIGKAKAAAQLLGSTKCSADQIIKFLTTVETDAVREQNANNALWSKAVASANAANGFPADAVEPAKSDASAKGPDNVWASAIAKVNAMNGFVGDVA